MDKTSLGEYVRRLRHERSLPLRSVAAACEVDSTLLSRIERGERLPTEKQIAALAKFFKVSKCELMGRVMADRVSATAGVDKNTMSATATILQARASQKGAK